MKATEVVATLYSFSRSTGFDCKVLCIKYCHWYSLWAQAISSCIRDKVADSECWLPLSNNLPWHQHCGHIDMSANDEQKMSICNFAGVMANQLITQVEQLSAEPLAQFKQPYHQKKSLQHQVCHQLNLLIWMVN